MNLPNGIKLHGIYDMNLPIYFLYYENNKFLSKIRGKNASKYFILICLIFVLLTSFLSSISGYICHGGWREPLPSQNTFSKVQAAASIVAASTSSSSDVMASRQDQQNPLEGGGSAVSQTKNIYFFLKCNF